MNLNLFWIWIWNLIAVFSLAEKKIQIPLTKSSNLRSLPAANHKTFMQKSTNRRELHANHERLAWYVNGNGEIPSHLHANLTKKIKFFGLANLTVNLNKNNKLVAQEVGLIPLENFLEFQFFGIVQLGKPFQSLKVCFDTGSSDFWVPSTNCQNCAGSHRFNPNKSSTAVFNSQNAFTVSYGSGDAKGKTVQERLQWGNFTLDSITVGLVESEALQLVNMQSDGLLGMAFDGLATFQHPTVFGSLIANKKNIMKPIFSFYFTPVASQPGSKLLLGGYDSSILKKLNAQWLQNSILPEVMINENTGIYAFWRIAMNRMEIGNRNLGDATSFDLCRGGGCSAIVDTGTSLLGIPVSQYLLFLNGLYLATQAKSCFCTLTQYGFQCFLCAFEDFPTLTFGFSDQHHFSLTGKDYVMCSGLVCIPLIQPSGVNNYYILGDVFLKKYYSLFNFADKTVSFACNLSSNLCGTSNVRFNQIALNDNPEVMMPLVKSEYSEDQLHAVVVLLTSGLSMIGSAFIIGCFWHYPQLQTKRVLALVLWLSSCNFLYNLIIWIAGMSAFRVSSSWCEVQVLSQQFVGLAVVLFSGLISLELYRAVRDLTAQTKDYTRFYHILTWGFCCLATTVASVTNTTGQIPDFDGPDMRCWRNRESNWMQIFCFDAPVLTTMLISIVAVKVAMQRLNETNLLETESGRRSATLLISYVFVFLLCYSLSLILGIVKMFGQLSYIPRWLVLVNAVLFYSQGILNCFVWAFSPSFRQVYHDEARMQQQYDEGQYLLTEQRKP